MIFTGEELGQIAVWRPLGGKPWARWLLFDESRLSGT
jgi:hypothetical protein